jgi:hypothetical protein
MSSCPATLAGWLNLEATRSPGSIESTYATERMVGELTDSSDKQVPLLALVTALAGFSQDVTRVLLFTCSD